MAKRKPIEQQLREVRDPAEVMAYLTENFTQFIHVQCRDLRDVTIVAVRLNGKSEMLSGEHIEYFDPPVTDTLGTVVTPAIPESARARYARAQEGLELLAKRDALRDLIDEKEAPYRKQISEIKDRMHNDPEIAELKIRESITRERLEKQLAFVWEV